MTILKEIATKIGPVLRIDANTTKKKGKYARFYVQLDLDKPLHGKLQIERLRQDIW